MAIAFDAASDGGVVNPDTTLSWSHTCTGAHLTLFVAARGTNTNGTDNVTGVTYGAAALTRVDHILAQLTQTRAFSLWKLVGATAGTDTVTITGSPADVLIGIAASYSGAGDVEAVSKSLTDTGGTLTDAVTTLTDGAWVVSGWGANTANITVGIDGDGGVRRVDNSSGAAFIDSDGPVSPPATFSINGVGMGGGAVCDVMVALAPYSAPPPTPTYPQTFAITVMGL